jgi:hypothetical protein
MNPLLIDFWRKWRPDILRWIAAILIFALFAWIIVDYFDFFDSCLNHASCVTEYFARGVQAAPARASRIGQDWCSRVSCLAPSLETLCFGAAIANGRTSRKHRPRHRKQGDASNRRNPRGEALKIQPAAPSLPVEATSLGLSGASSMTSVSNSLLRSPAMIGSAGNL